MPHITLPVGTSTIPIPLSQRTYRLLLRRSRISEPACPLEIGVPPDDLLDVTARLIVAAPGVAAARALLQIAPDAPVESIATHAAVISRGGRTLFNVQEVTGLIRGLRRGAGLPYWRLVLDYCVDGCLQSVLDEYAHVLVEHTGSSDRMPESAPESWQRRSTTL